MSARTASVLSLICCSWGCITQRSLLVGQPAAAVGAGGADVSVATGVGYVSQTTPSISGTDGAGNPTSTQLAGRGFSLPWVEANIDYGLADRFGLNLHLSPAGFQPGVKFTLNRSKVAQVALLPELGIGYASYGQATYVAGADGKQTEAAPSWITSFLFTAGLKALVSHRSGFYAGLGYHLYATRSTNNTSTGGASPTVTQTLTTSIEHQIGVAAGFSFNAGPLMLRPELAFAIIPGISGSQKTGSAAAISGGGGMGWAILPALGVALSSKKASTRPESDDEGSERESPPDEEEDRPKEREHDYPE